MAKRLRVTNDKVSYPHPQHLQAVIDAGGCEPGLTKEQRKKFIKHVKRGGWCDDMPKMAIQHQLEKGNIEEVEVAAPKKTPAPKKGVSLRARGDGASK